MYWEEPRKAEAEYQVPDEVLDLVYKIDCKILSLDHAQSLSTALIAELPWLVDEPLAGIHLIHAAESGNGWLRPENPEKEVLNLSKRTKFHLRLPKHRLSDAQKLQDSTIVVDGYKLHIGKSTPRKLSKSPIIFSRYVVTDSDDEAEFLKSVHGQLKTMGVPVRKMMCGKFHSHRVTAGKMLTRSLMIADLEVEQSVLLQQQGLGSGRLLGCGLFLAHKGIIAVNHEAEKIQSKDF